MSTQSAQSQAAGEQAQWQAELSRQLAGVSLPELQSLTQRLTTTLGSGSSNAAGMLSPDAGVLSSATNQLNAGYNQAGFGSREAIGYGALRGGESRLSPGAVNSSVMGAATSLDRDRASALQNLNFQSAQSSLGDYNQVLSLLGQGSQTALGLAGGFGGAANAAIGGLSSQSQFGSTLGGAASGAAMGSTIAPGWGTLIGGVVGAGAGYLGGGG